MAIKGAIHPKNLIVSVFTQPHAAPKLYDFPRKTQPVEYTFKDLSKT